MRRRVRLKELLRTRLIECGWRDQLKVQCKEVVREKGLENVTVDDLVTVITPKGRGQAAGLDIRKHAQIRVAHVNITCLTMAKWIVNGMFDKDYVLVINGVTLILSNFLGMIVSSV